MPTVEEMPCFWGTIMYGRRMLLVHVRGAMTGASYRDNILTSIV